VAVPISGKRVTVPNPENYAEPVPFSGEKTERGSKTLGWKDKRLGGQDELVLNRGHTARGGTGPRCDLERGIYKVGRSDLGTGEPLPASVPFTP